MASRPEHVHEWRMVSEEFDIWGVVRLYECRECPAVRYV
jgi:hypothetical protein